MIEEAAFFAILKNRFWTAFWFFLYRNMLVDITLVTFVQNGSARIKNGIIIRAVYPRDKPPEQIAPDNLPR